VSTRGDVYSSCRVRESKWYSMIKVVVLCFVSGDRLFSIANDLEDYIGVANS
jgi:hypothetical protein